MSASSAYGAFNALEPYLQSQLQNAPFAIQPRAAVLMKGAAKVGKGSTSATWKHQASTFVSKKKFKVDENGVQELMQDLLHIIRGDEEASDDEAADGSQAGDYTKGVSRLMSWVHAISAQVERSEQAPMPDDFPEILPYDDFWKRTVHPRVKASKKKKKGEGIVWAMGIFLSMFNIVCYRKLLLQKHQGLAQLRARIHNELSRLGTAGSDDFVWPDLIDVTLLDLDEVEDSVGFKVLADEHRRDTAASKWYRAVMQAAVTSAPLDHFNNPDGQTATRSIVAFEEVCSTIFV